MIDQDMSLLDKNAAQLRQRLDTGEISSVELTKDCLRVIESRDRNIGAFLSIRAERAIAEAAEIDRRRSAGHSVGILGGLPVAVKDLLCMRGEITTCGSKMLASFRPPYSATVIERLRSAGAIIVGKLNLDEFAMGGSTENSAFQRTCNPWNRDRVPGGSSGGSAAAVAAGMAALTIGTDTGGSIRQPASFCGVVGLKPTYGRVSRFGLVAFASSLDQIGPLARTVPDAALLLEAIAGHDPLDSTSAPLPVPKYSQTVSLPVDNLRIGVPREYFQAGVDAEVEAAVRAALRVYESMGAELREVSLPHSKYGIAAYYIIAPSEASSNLARYDGAHYGYRTDETAMLRRLTAEAQSLRDARDEAELENLDTPLIRMYRQSRTEAFGPEVKRRIMLGTYALSAGYYDAYYLKALKVRRLIRRDFDEAFRSVDVIAGPVAPTTAFSIGEMVDDPLAMYLQDLFTVSTNLAGIPGISVPCGLSGDGLPIGLQLQAAPFEEERLLRAAQMFQSATDWHLKRPGWL
jgi:aspartyl-tRNA(Asn)/glutamyl-tRNA(Gln) amidotransferase subunit A